MILEYKNIPIYYPYKALCLLICIQQSLYVYDSSFRNKLVSNKIANKMRWKIGIYFTEWHSGRWDLLGELKLLNWELYVKQAVHVRLFTLKFDSPLSLCWRASVFGGRASNFRTNTKIIRVLFCADVLATFIILIK